MDITFEGPSPLFNHPTPAHAPGEPPWPRHLVRQRAHSTIDAGGDWLAAIPAYHGSFALPARRHPGANRWQPHPTTHATQRDDELGELVKRFDGMAQKTQGTITQQRQLLADLSHEIRARSRG